jgi:di/tricarboxylate transporter
MTESGAAAWLGSLFVTQLTALTISPPVVIALLVVAVALVHLAITNLAACMALLIPIAVTTAEAAHLNPLVCGLVVTIAVDAIILYPVQTAANLLAYEAGYFHTADVRRLGLGMLLLTIVVALLVLPYWSLLALPLTQP